MNDNSLTRIHGNQIENMITFQIKTRYYLELLTSEKMKLLGSTENMINKDKIVKIHFIHKLLKHY